MKPITTDTGSSQQTAVSTIEQFFQQAMDHHQAGRLQEAGTLYRAIIQVQPNHPDANYGLGVLAVLEKQPIAALPHFEAALEADQNQGQYWLSYMDALIQAGQADAARLLLDLVRKRGLEGDEVDALAARLEEEAPSASPSGSQQKESPNAEEMTTLADLFTGGHLAEAAILAQAMTVRFPLHGFGWKALGAAFMKIRPGKDALASMQKAAELMPDDFEAHSNLGSILSELYRLDESEASYRRALQIKPDHAIAHSNLGAILQKLGRPDEAEASFQRALEIDPKCSEALRGLGQLRMESGQMEAAEGLFLKALEIKPGNLRAHFCLAIVKKVKPGNANFAALVAAAAAAQDSETTPSREDRIHLHFALGKCCDDTGDYEKAFPHFLEGCKLKRATFSYNHELAARDFSELMQIFNKAAIDRLRGTGHPSRQPIFVLGMPRSGTTLTEQIIASHPDVYGAGELLDLRRILRQDEIGTATQINFLDNLRSLDRATLAAWGTEYAAGLQRRAPDARRITDKMPGNFIAVGLIHLMLPNAKIIHVRRNPVDTCLSCFTLLFSSGHEFTYDLAELGQHYAHYARLMEHWRNVLPAGAFLDVNYEDIVADKETQTRRMLEYCGLAWSDACLDFHKTKRLVRTSMTQVRQPLYNSSVERWRHYEKFLDPLLDALGDFAPKHHAK